MSSNTHAMWKGVCSMSALKFCVKLFVVLVYNEISRYKQLRYRGFRLDVLTSALRWAEVKPKLKLSYFK